MANNLNFRRIVQLSFMEALAGYTPRFSRIGRLMTGPAGTVKVGKVAMGGIAVTVADSATSVAAQDIASFQATFETAERVVKHTTPAHLMQTEQGMIDAGQQLSQVAGKNIDRDFFGVVEGLFSANSPRAGAGVGQVGAGKLYLDTGKKGLQGEGGEFLYSNLLTSALSESALHTAVQYLQAQRDDRGLQMGLGESGLAIVGAAKNAGPAHELIKSLMSGADNAANYLQGLFGGGWVPWEFTDDDDWMVIDTNHSPLGYYLARGASVEVRESDDGLFHHWVVKYHGVPVYSPYEYGIVGSNVA